MVEQFPALARQLDEQFFTDKLIPISFKWLNDSVYSIRVAAIENLKELTKIFGSQWAEKNVIKKLLDLKAEKNYLYRLTVLFGMAELSQVLTPDVVKKLFVPVLQTMSKDPIPNIRLNVAKTILKMRNKYKSQSSMSATDN